MPVNILFCEGGKNSPDIRVLRALLPATCRIKGAGSKYAFDRRILFLKQESPIPSAAIAGIRDRDFDDDETPPRSFPRVWEMTDNTKKVNIGWSWERKEIENYLTDPEVVRHALGLKSPPPDKYRKALQTSAQMITDYTAARVSLSLYRVQPMSLKNNWGEKRWKMPFPDQFGENDCRSEIGNIIDEYKQVRIVKKADVLKTFDTLLPACRPGGVRFKHYMTFFAGKDLLCGMHRALDHFNLGSPSDFRERVIVGIERSAEDVWTWLPEWQRLRELILK
ncbi:hypothetical protein [Desulfonema magnum]|uniref:DUF4435 domain-containing protein n=1 Tax=Desulfonema magnum TaxID=45655 RepID=A0A975BYQ9_9BACT|nr:hypothetical protein [Desulfonema magnum]QTA93475.1 Uncharacterized protein dnm_095760 [Desulfonema magnum]